MKPTPEEILRKAGYDEDAIFISYETVVKYMQKYAEQYYKEKMREELIAYESYCCNCIPGLPNPPDEEKAILKLIDEYLKTKQ